ncbi:BLUF domain-containing protein [Pontibacter sp. SGAir0037]|uniref:BLUF domain-containing protein n=1 Tax=Pontibacter sp. SGAir0037 TaxID=2571030 RepID=UPI0010CD5464|nr:BLUF domain-containing protein [Pontibacter sp. SGAir0037]QCR21888.1 hypothetical protein C1N53_05745 [Pontibacter sp. SGAir0037]
MHHLVYLSSAVEEMNDEQLAHILQKSRENNSKNGITGILLYSDGNFIQVLEGEKQALFNTFNRIKYDYRHRGIIEMLNQPLKKRNFPDWSMGFKTIAASEFTRFAGFVDLQQRTFLNQELQQQEQDAITLLKIFAADNIR